MKYKITLITFSLIFFNILNAKEHNINLLLDKNSNQYLNEIKKETQSLFSSSDKIVYTISLCEEDCENLNHKNKFVLLNQNKKLEKTDNAYIITYNFIDSKYDENKVIRATALGIYEYLKENKKRVSIYFENSKNKVFEEEIRKKRVK